MPEAQRPRAVEYYNPRPLLLGLCFFWGIVVGFSLFYFAPPKEMDRTVQKPPDENPVVTPVPPSIRRDQDRPEIVNVDPAPDSGASLQPRMETLVIEPPVPALITDGGLTGRTAQPLTDPSRRPPAATTGLRPTQPRMTPPPMPELMP